jgi:esterase/lipase
MNLPERILRCIFIRVNRCSIYTSAQRPSLPLILYSHTFSGNKIEGKFLFEYFLPNFSICLFDFHGCGNAEGEYVTLGLKEKHDIEEALLVIQEKLNPPRIYIWGRSMGAVAIIHLLNTYSGDQKISKKKSLPSQDKCYKDAEHYKKIKTIIEKKVKAVVLDSPFTDAYKMIEDILKFEKNMNGLITKLILLPVRNSIKNNLNVDVLGKNKPIALVEKITIPALFMIGEKDTMVNQDQYKDMFDRYGSDKKSLHYLVETNHSDCRNAEDLYRAYLFINSYEETALEDSNKDLSRSQITQNECFKQESKQDNSDILDSTNLHTENANIQCGKNDDKSSLKIQNEVNFKNNENVVTSPDITEFKQCETINYSNFDNSNFSATRIEKTNEIQMNDLPTGPDMKVEDIHKTNIEENDSISEYIKNDSA